MIELIFAHIDWIAVSLSIGGILLNAKRIIWCWPVWILSNICWFIHVFSKPKEGAAILLWVTFAIANTYGWREWFLEDKRQKERRQDGHPSREIPAKFAGSDEGAS